MPALSRAERDRLCDTALEVGPDAPTLCGDWTVHDLLVHLVVREQDPLGAPGILVKRLSFLTERASRRLGREDLTTLVEKVRRPPIWSPTSLGPLDRAINTVEFFVHHEDIRRAAPGWQPRVLTDSEQRQLWKAIGFGGKGLVRSAGVPVVIRWDGTDRRATLRKGDHPVTVTGAPGELVLFLFGRQQLVDLAFDGPPASVSRIRSADLGL